MEIPEKIDMRALGLEHRMAWYFQCVYVDTHGFGIRYRVKGVRGVPIKEIWTLAALPKQEFPTLEALREAAAPLTEAEVAAVMAQYPKIIAIRPGAGGQRCHVCAQRYPPARGPLTADVRIARTWSDIDIVFLCDRHLEQYRNDPKGLCEALAAADAAQKERYAQDRLNRGK